ncbi:MAG: hypothetical protein EBT63_05325, partial [Proteobacteria bacterium]|nr:hypothetical protein [Pseudomonadota bacterium]
MRKLTKKTRTFFLLTLLIANCFFTKKSYADISIIRESETEQFLREICFPIFKIAGFDTKNIKIYIVNDNSINAFVMGGQNIFINTGLIKKFSNPDVLSGVIAHEVGHIASGHLAKSSEEFKNNASATLIGYILGIGALASGRPDVGSAIILGSSHMGNRMALKYNRSQEESADILALEYLQKLKISNSGLLEIMEYFNQQNKGTSSEFNSYDLTHPMSSSRILLIKNFSKNNFSKFRKNQKLIDKLKKIQAKLSGFLDEPQNLLEHKNSYFDQYSLITKSIAYHRLAEYEKSFEILDYLLKNNPRDGFLYELKAEFLFNENKIYEAILNYKKALDYLDEASKTLAQIAFANAILELKSNDKFLLNLAIENLQKSQKYESENALIFKSLASAYTLDNNDGMAFLALAEYNYILNEHENAQKLAEEA